MEVDVGRAAACRNMNLAEWYRDRRVIVTGGLGFVGSNLAHRLVGLGASVRIVDVAAPGSGANLHNVEGILPQIELWRADLRDRAVVEAMLDGEDVLFNLAAQVGHAASMQDPEYDLSINAVCQLSIVEACRRLRPDIKVVYTATRQMYGRADDLPIDETQPINPVDYNGVSKRAGELFHLVAHRAHGLRATSLRLTNTYGPRMRCRDARLTFLGDWMRRLLMDEPLVVFGTGEQIRDFNYVEDVVDALLAAAADPRTDGQIYNLGSDEPVRLIDLAQMAIDVFGRGRFELAPFPPDRLSIDIGDYQGDYSRIRDALTWRPSVSLREGLRRTLDFVDCHRAWYL